ncbi:ubiquitin carboxyl-terminal hydrolase 1 [Drosophila grimshawi]|uniref:GH14306 n=1 Tax=Drosophila grimshawi TaxID=7222 RepID=B4JYJ4_DROGR|nr:ubiquitin carboxyl-terminal hydrolase 1 [Drosophila grimshawi]XP_032597404.1 ubiquitin carboxyl-terminal hydrolase 1 [Drosophila grimshawi]EDV90756.1 GH14306 [Drosophila grimshawi]
MHEYDINELREEQARLPTSTSSTSTSSKNNCRNNQQQLQQQIHIQSPRQETTTLHLLQQSQQEASTNLIATDDPQQLSPSSSYSSATYPATQHEYTDPIVEPPKAKVEVQVPKRRRQRRVYVAEFSRCASLRSRQLAPVEVIPLPEIPLTPSPTPTEVIEDHKSYYIKPEHFNSEFWNRIEEVPEVKPTGRKRRGAVGFRNRKRRNRPDLDTSSIFSPETTAAIAAAQIELDSAKPVSRAFRKRKLSSGNMSLYDRRYQTSNDEQRRVANGYAGGNGLRAGNSAGAGDIDTADLQITHHYYVPGVGGSSSSSIATTGTGSGLNGSVGGGSGSAALNHVPAMGTLCNIGNTCYLNSVVYTLRCAPHFLHNLHHLIHDLNVVQQTMLRQHNAKSASLGRNVSGAAQLEHARSWSSKDLATTEPSYNNSTVSVTNGSNTSNNGNNTSGSSTNKKSSHQVVSEMLHELYNSLHGNEMADSSEPYHADTLLHAVQDVNATFEGNQQQDAHEFLMCLLNCIRETNQSLLKAIADCPEVIANGYIANPDDADTVDALERSDAGGNYAMLGTAGNGSIATSQSQNTTTTKTSFFSRKSKRKDDVKSSKATRLQSPLKDNSPTTASGMPPQAHAASNSLFYLNTVDLSGASGATTGTATPSASVSMTNAPAPAKYSSDDEISSAIQLKDKMRLEERIRELNLNFFNKDFEGIVVLTTKCLSCETITRQKQGMLDISVPVPISGYDTAELQEKPSAYIQNSCITREYFRGDNKYSCNQCTGYTEAIRSISYEVLPRLLVIQLNRFSGGMEKVSTYVPTTFTLPCFCAKCCELSDANKLHVYKLYSVITHVGATLTVGHYIAYTCILDLASDYVNCPKDRRNNTSSSASGQQQQASSSAGGNENTAPSSNNGSISIASTPVSAAASALASSGTSLIKKMKFGRSKASSSGDMSKNVKQLNGFTSKTITNGIGKLSMNTTCHGVNCCAMRLCCSQQASAAGSNSASSSDFSEESLQNGSNSNLSYGSSASNNCPPYPVGYGSTGRGGVKANYAANSSEPTWYMCDDDKVKAMSQRDFEELLSPTRKITITPYLLFYARFDLQPAQATPPKPNASSTPPPPPTASHQQQQQQPQSSWSNDNLQSGLHKM